MLNEELNWLEEVVADRTRILSENGYDRDAKDIYEISPSPLSASDYASLVGKNELSGDERLLLVLALAPHFDQNVFEPLRRLRNESREFCAGGILHEDGTFIPTGETALFLLAGTELAKRISRIPLLEQDGKGAVRNLFHLQPAPAGKPLFSGMLTASREMMDIVIRGFVGLPEYGTDFPARRITTEMEWDDLVLSASSLRQVEEVKIWLRQRERLMNELGMSKRLKPGNKILFYGPPGTGKTLTATLLGKFIEKEVFRIDLSMIVSKYIGETEKNLAKIFDKAEHSGWILFFDEADALFGSRTKVSDAHDRYANQEVSYLLQRIEEYDGIVILATNMKGNIDDAFMRRFNGVVHFPFPKSEERRRLWKKTFPEKITFSGEVDLHKVADKYDLTGAHITNVVAWCSLMALEKGNYVVTESMIREGMARELAKEGRTL